MKARGQKLLKTATARSKVPEFGQLFQQRRQAMLEEQEYSEQKKSKQLHTNVLKKEKSKDILQMGLW